MIKAPPPPSEPAPPNQPTIHSTFRLPPIEATSATTTTIRDNGMHNNQMTMNDLSSVRPQPKPRKPQLPSLPKVKALYDYCPQDLDELELKEGEIIEVLKERKY
jgi:myosin-1